MSKFERLENQKDSINSGNTIAVFWSVEDVMSVASEAGREITKEDAKKILFDVEHSHDACVGINWDVISCHLDELKINTFQ